MNRKFVYLGFGLAATLGASDAWATKITSIGFKAGSDSSEIDIAADSPVAFDKSENQQDKQIVIDLKGATLSKGASRKLDTSSFNSKVNLISPYKVDGDSRVVIQLRDMTSADVTQDGNVLRVKVAEGGQAAPEAVPSSTPNAASGGGNLDTLSVDNNTVNAAANAALAAPDTSAQPPVSSAAQAASAATDEEMPAKPRTKLDQFIESQQTRKFVGRPITIKLREAELSDVFRLVAEASGFNIVLGDDVKGKITVSLENVPWDQALDVILHTEHLGAERNNNVLRVVTLTNLTKEKQEELQAKLATEAAAPRITRIFPVSYAKLDELVGILSKFAGTSTTVPGAQATATPTAPGAVPSAAVVQADSRTNSVVVRDTAENVDRIRKLIEILDTQTPQVLIEGKVVEVTENNLESHDGALGFGNFFGNPPYAIGVNNGETAVQTGNFTLSTASTSNSTNGISAGFAPTLGFLSGTTRLNAVLNLQETESKLKVISSPRTVVLDKEKATVIQSTPVAVPANTIVNGVVTAGVNILQANISLTVTPTVTNEGSVLLDLNLNRDVVLSAGQVQGFGIINAVGNRNVTTKVLVESGSTLVLGGVYDTQDNEAAAGIPYLRNIPVLGWLFGSASHNLSRSELFFFITPRILNPKEAGLTASST